MIVFKKIAEEGPIITYSFDSIYSGQFSINTDTRKIIVEFNDDAEFLHFLLHAISESIIKQNYPDRIVHGSY